MANDWRWQPRGDHWEPRWIATDQQGREWFVKMTGAFNALRERVFDQIAQEVGLSCQSCVFLTLPKDSLPLQSNPKAEQYQGAITYIPQHDETSCADCPIPLARKRAEQLKSGIAIVAETPVTNMSDRLVGNLLGYLCGANERLETVLSTNHQLFLVDSELTLLAPPDHHGAVQYIRTWCADRTDWNHAKEIIIPKLTKFANLPDATLRRFTEIPAGYKVRKGRIPQRLFKFRKAADRLARTLQRLEW